MLGMLFSAGGEAMASATVLDVVRRAAARDGFIGLVVVVEDGKILATESIGSPLPFSRAVWRMDQPIPACSISKLMVAELTHRLVTAGKLRYEDSVRDHVPGLPKHLAPIRINDLLTHSSGLPDRSHAFMAQRQRPPLHALLGTRLEFPPGRKFQYNNLDTVLLGEVVEAKYRKPLLQLLRGELGLGSATLDLAGSVPAYRTVQGSVQFDDRRRFTNFGAAGGYVFTPADLVKFGWAQMGRFRPAAKPYLRFGFVTRGAFMYPVGKETVINRSGAIGSYSHDLVWVPGKDRFILRISNCGDAKLRLPYEGSGLDLELINLPRVTPAVPGPVVKAGLTGG